MYLPECVICGKRITWSFWVCADCESDYDLVGVRYAEWPEWLRFLVSDEKRLRDRASDNNRIRDGKEAYLEDASEWENGFCYSIEDWIIVKQEYINIVIDDSDGYFELQDSDWESVFSYGG